MELSEFTSTKLKLWRFFTFIFLLFRVDVKSVAGGFLEFTSFNISASFGPFGSTGFELALAKCSSGPVLLLIGSAMIYGLTLYSGSLLFEFRFDFLILKSLLLNYSSLFTLGADGVFRLIEVFYETGQVIGSWSLTSDADACIENFTIEFQDQSSLSKLNLAVELAVSSIGRVICIYSLDPLSEVISCRFRNWIIGENVDDKKLPSIVYYNNALDSLLNS